MVDREVELTVSFVTPGLTDSVTLSVLVLSDEPVVSVDTLAVIAVVTGDIVVVVFSSVNVMLSVLPNVLVVVCSESTSVVMLESSVVAESLLVEPVESDLVAAL